MWREGHGGRRRLGRRLEVVAEVVEVEGAVEGLFIGRRGEGKGGGQREGKLCCVLMEVGEAPATCGRRLAVWWHKGDGEGTGRQMGGASRCGRWPGGSVRRRAARARLRASSVAALGVCASDEAGKGAQRTG